MFDDESIRRAQGEAQQLENRLLDWLKRLRRATARGQFTALDTLMQRGGGYISRVLAGKEKIYLDRFLLALSALRAPWRSLLTLLDPPSPIPAAPPPGYLQSFPVRGRKALDLDYLDPLAEWVDVVTVEPTGRHIDIDAEFAMAFANDEQQIACDLIDAHLQSIAKAQPSAIDAPTARAFVSLLGTRADLARTAGALSTAQTLIEISFAIERRANDLGRRSFLYRTAAYLLSDLGELDEAAVFTESALSLSLATPTCEGLGQSMYVRAVMISRRGDYETAATLYEAALSQLARNRQEQRASVYLAMGYAFLQTRNEARAAAALDQAWSVGKEHQGLLGARIRCARGELASRQGDLERAEGLFSEARRLLETDGAPSDVAVVELMYARHVMRTRELERARTLVYRVSRLVNQLDRHPIGEAAVLELLRHVARGTLTAAALAHTIHRLESPWRYLKQLD